MNFEDIEQALKDLDREIVDYNDNMTIGIYLCIYICMYVSQVYIHITCVSIWYVWYVGTDAIEKMRLQLRPIVQKAIQVSSSTSSSPSSSTSTELSLEELINAILRYVLIAASRSIAGMYSM